MESTVNDTTDAATSEYMHSMPTTITIGVTTSLVAILTTFGNFITLLAFLLRRSLRNFGDYFILNLAVADMAIGGFSIPPYIPYLLTGRWSAGKAFCKFWLLWDYITPAASTFNMCVISIDRYLMVGYPIEYRKHQGTKLLLLMLLSSWAIVTVIYGSSILLWEVVTGVETIEDGQCYVPFAFHFPFLLFVSFVEFVFPLVMMIIIHTLIIICIRKRLHNKVGHFAGPTCKVDAPSTSHYLTSNGNSKPAPEYVEKGNGFVNVRMDVGTTNGESENLTDFAEMKRKQTITDSIYTSNHFLHAHSVRKPEKDESPHGPNHSGGDGKTNLSAALNHSGGDGKTNLSAALNLKRDRKAVRSLFILVFVFCLCWMPFEILSLIKATCPTCVDPDLFEVSFWLLWLNSTINPILYPLLHKRFRDALLGLWRDVKKCNLHSGT